MSAVPTPRDMALEIIRSLPSSSSIEDIMYELRFISSIQKGLNEVAEGKVMSTNDLRKQLKKLST